ncbi:MAG: sensor domain-containing protein [Dehalococcoidia bacterium]|nr:sensor domain-containing protein [Dehalococcoidia bacterium]
MVKSVDEYLALLKKELAGSDPAVIQDALADAEEHLRMALAQAGSGNASAPQAEVFSAIAEKYGSPQEIAAAYRQMEARLPAGLGRTMHASHRSLPHRFFGVVADPRAWGALLFLFLSLVTGIIYFWWTVFGLSISVATLVLVIGLPLLVLFLLSIRGIAFVEGRLVEALLGVRMPRRRMFFDDTTGFWRKIKELFTQRITWTALLYCILKLGLGIAYAFVFGFLFGLSIYLIALPITVWAFQMPAYVVLGDTEYLATDWSIPLFFILGVLLLPATMHLVRLVGRGHGALAKAMLVSKHD